MKRRYLRIDSTTGLRSLLLLGAVTITASFACDSGTGSSDPEPMKPAGGAPSTGGASTGGTATGGVTTGGQGGASGSGPTGGAATGGAATGGAATGGAGVSGAAPGGSVWRERLGRRGWFGWRERLVQGRRPDARNEHRVSSLSLASLQRRVHLSDGLRRSGRQRQLAVQGAAGRRPWRRRHAARRPENMDDTVSEGMAYGMLFAVYMNDRKPSTNSGRARNREFDDKGLMHWQISST